MSKPSRTDIVRSAINEGRTRRSIRQNERGAQLDRRLTDLRAANAMGRISDDITKTIGATDKIFDTYHDYIAKILRRFGRKVKIKEWKVLESRPLDSILTKEYDIEKIKDDIDVSMKWFDKVWNYWTYLDDDQLKLLLPYLMRGIVMTLHMIHSVYGEVNLDEFSYSLVILKYTISLSAIKDKKGIEMGVYEFMEKDMDYYRQFGMKLPETYEEDKKKLEEEKKKREKLQRKIWDEAQMEKALEESKKGKRNKIRDQRKKHSQKFSNKKKKKRKTRKGESEMAKMIRKSRDTEVEEEGEEEIPPDTIVEIKSDNNKKKE